MELFGHINYMIIELFGKTFMLTHQNTKYTSIIKQMEYIVDIGFDILF